MNGGVGAGYCESFNLAAGLKSVEDNLNKIRTLRLEEKQKHQEELCQELEATTKKKFLQEQNPKEQR